MALLSIDKEKCNNCYKCLRACPSKAIRMLEDRTEVVEDRCVFCGKCQAICPQKAITVQSDLFEIRRAITEGRLVVASLAPSFAGVFEEKEPEQLSAALRLLGFSHVEETAAGAALVTEAYRNQIEEGRKGVCLSSSCPAVVNLVEKYHPELTDCLLPVKSPMLAHGELLKFLYGKEAFTVFLGPCIAKKQEAAERGLAVIDAVLTFEELAGWLSERDIRIPELEPVPFDNRSSGVGAAYPLRGGIAGALEDLIPCHQVDGVEEAKEMLEWLEEEGRDAFVEISLCRGSCTGGPAMPSGLSNYYRREASIRSYSKALKERGTARRTESLPPVDLSAAYRPKPVKRPSPSEDEIREILRRMWKHSEADELNCEACGYRNCREKAAAVHEGMAEISMCLPYMRARAESLRNILFDNSPNIVLMLDKDLRIKEINPRAEEVFQVKAKHWRGRFIGELMDETSFRQVLESGEDLYGRRNTYGAYGITLLENILHVREQEVLLAIMTDVTRQEKHQKDLAEMKAETIEAAQKVIDKQMRVAQEIASLLGETTAETKVTLMKLKRLSQKEGGGY